MSVLSDKELADLKACIGDNPCTWMYACEDLSDTLDAERAKVYILVEALTLVTGSMPNDAPSFEAARAVLQQALARVGR
jgi:hypothetical protein